MDPCSYKGHLSQLGNIAENGNFGDTALRLNCLEFGRNNQHKYGCARANIQVDFTNSPDDSCRLVLGLGPTPATSCDGLYNGRYKMHKQMLRAVRQGLSSESESILCLGLSESASYSSCGFDDSMSTKINFNCPPCLVDQMSSKSNLKFIPVADEGSTSARKSGGHMPPLLMAPNQVLYEFETEAVHIQESISTTGYSHSALAEQTTMRTDLRKRTVNSKKCRFLGCTKCARGASGLCISHGGGQRCQKPGCCKSAESRTRYCKVHGGGKRCLHLGCTKSAEGKTEHCIGHGGGRRCGFVEGCSKAARGKSGLCIKHGGGKRCKAEGCTRSAEGHDGLCIAHGGGRRCEFNGCSKGAQGRTVFCKAHGGGKRCVFVGCDKGAEGSTALCKGHGGGKRCLFDGGGICPKSVHGGTNFCVAHGGGKRCAVPGCTKSARGRSDCCVKHGGGKRCQFKGCGKSAQGSTEFCKAHGGGKRCSLGEGKCDKFARGKNGLCVAHGSTTLVCHPNKRGGPSDDHESSSAVAISNPIDRVEKQTIERRQLMPSDALVPPSMKTSTSYSTLLSSEKSEETINAGFEFVAPEGRVHGGGLMWFFGGNMSNAICDRP